MDIFHANAYGITETENWHVIEHAAQYPSSLETIASKVREALEKQQRTDFSRVGWSFVRAPDQKDFVITTYRGTGTGHVKITSWRPRDVHFQFMREDRIAIEITFTYTLTILIPPEIPKPSYHFEDNHPIPIGEIKIDHASEEFDQTIPLHLIWRWTKGQIEDGTNGIEFEFSDQYWLHYNVGVYPRALFEFFKSMGRRAFAQLREWDVVDEDVLLLINNRLRNYEPVVLKPAPTIQVTPDLMAKETDRAFYLGLAADMRSEDLQRLRIIESQQLAPHSFTAWTTLLGFNSKGGTGPFIARMSQAGLLLDEKLAEGTRLRLTEKAKKILSLTRNPQ